MECYGPPLAGRDEHAVEGGQSPDRKLHAGGDLMGRAHIHLRHLVAAHIARVADTDLHVQPAVGGLVDPQAGVSEGCVAQAVAEGEERLDLFAIKPAVAYIDALTEGCLAVRAFLRTLGMPRVGGGVVLQAPGPGNR